MIVLSAKIKELMDELKKNNYETYFHCLRVKKIVNKMILKLNEDGITYYTLDEIDYICKGAFLHDIGKLYVRNFVLTKEGSLDTLETDEIHKHPEAGYEAIESELNEDERDIVRNICLYHHERIDGNGYNKLKDVPVYVQLVSIADVFEALTADRPYHDSVSDEKALEMIKEGECGKFDPRIFEYLKRAVCSQ
ncbi:MAG: HD domain-containing protein [Clostridia bacterium]|nr:HD domain-containing protein [Clostridia bacterium]